MFLSIWSLKLKIVHEYPSRANYINKIVVHDLIQPLVIGGVAQQNWFLFSLFLLYMKTQKLCNIV